MRWLCPPTISPPRSRQRRASFTWSGKPRPGDQTRPYDFVLSFGGAKDAVGAFYIGKAFGADDLILMLSKLGVAKSEGEITVQALKEQPKHEIPNVALSKALLRTLG
jgi:hypothetical protein